MSRDYIAEEQEKRLDSHLTDLGLQVCDECSAIIRDAEQHENWHANLSAPSTT